MARKFIKYGKFLMSVALVFCLIAPSYASLSASDGSAFVTKAEFDSALADFNSRLTTFEAGINSKIDSQVTSYLDRNGIWSGKDQNFAVSADFTVWNSGAVANWDKAGAKASTQYAGEIVLSTNVVCKANKTGMMYVEYEDYCSSNQVNYMQARMYYYKDKGNYTCDDSLSFLEKFVVLKEKIGDDKVDWQQANFVFGTAATPATSITYGTSAGFRYRKEGSSDAWTSLSYVDAVKEEKMSVINYTPLTAEKVNETYPGTRLITLPWLDLKHNCHTFFVKKDDWIGYYAKLKWGTFTSTSAANQWTDAEIMASALASQSKLYKEILKVVIY